MSRKALVVDSDFFFVEFLSGLLEKRGYRVDKAYDGKQGISQLAKGPFAIVFADLVLPKISGRQFFHFVRGKSNGLACPLVALSGTMLEQMEALEDIGADYFIAKGPLDRLASHLNEFISEIDSDAEQPPAEKKISQPGGVFPRRDAVELLQSLEFHLAVIESVGVGIVLIDKDTRIINANTAALAILDVTLQDLLNCPVTQAFPHNRSSELISALKATGRDPDSAHRFFFAGFPTRMVRVVVSTIRHGSVSVGWVLALEGANG
jgi:PAS domain S-box-containing protein